MIPTMMGGQINEDHVDGNDDDADGKLTRIGGVVILNRKHCLFKI